MLGTVAALSATVSCFSNANDEPELPRPDFIDFKDNAVSLTVPPTGGDIVLEFTTNMDWELVMLVGNGYQNGIPDCHRGSAGENCVIFTATPNTGMTERITPIKITAGRANHEIKLCQEVVPIVLPDESEVREYLMRLYNETDGPNWRFRGKWGSDLPLNQWGSEVKYENGRLELNLAEHYVKGKINLSGCKALVSIKCSKNQITELDVSDCPLLTFIDCTNTGLQKINLTGCYSLDRVSLGYNNLSMVDVGWCTTLATLYVNDCQLTELDLSQCVSLQDLGCYNNRLKKLDIPYRSRLRNLWCYENELSALDVSNSPFLNMFNCGDNEITDLNISGCTRLSSLYCYGNRLTLLNTTDQKDVLRDCYCFSNKLTSLDMSNYRMLTELHCSDNDISQLNITGCRRLCWLYCSYNMIEELDFTGLDTHLFQRLDCSNNKLRKMDLTQMTYLRHLWCKGNRIGGEIPEWFDQLLDFEHDARYEYRVENGTYTDRVYGWWYQGEPDKMIHKR